MHLEDRLLHAFTVVFYVCFFLGALVCTIAMPVGLTRPQEAETLFFIGMMGMVLVSPAILIIGIFLTLLGCDIRSQVKAHRNQRRTRSSCEEQIALKHPLQEDRVPDCIVWRLDETKGGVQ